MVCLNWESVGEGYPSSHQDDELLIVVSSDKQACPENWIIKLEQEATPALAREVEYLKSFGGFASNRQKPFLILRWTAFGKGNLEKRWLMAQFISRLHYQFGSIKKIAIFLAGDSIEPWQLSIAEDIFFYHCNHNYDSLKIDNIRVLAKNLGAVGACDPNGRVRFEFQKNFRSWVNEEPDIMTSIEIGARLKNFAEHHHCQFEEFDGEHLKKLGLNLLLAVGQASKLSPSRLFVVTANLKKGQQPLMLVGKGITFDTGGINVKPFEGFVNAMKNDMGGAALMSNLFMALVKAGYKKPLALVIPSCENLVAERSMKPGAIYKSHKGHSVVVDHTDAEGRLILADALSYGESRLNPFLTLVAATLTTASLRQFTGYGTPVHFAPTRFQEQLKKNGDSFGENFVFCEEFLPYRWANKGKVTSLTNMGRLGGQANIGGGSNVAAHFLKEFVDGPMIHFDIFASTWNWSGDYPGSSFGATGAAFNSLFATLLNADHLA